MKVLTWNLGYQQHTRHHAEALAYLRNELRPDVALLQEVSHTTLNHGEGIVYKDTGKKWGTAICVAAGTLEGLEIDKYPARVAAAIWRTPAGGELRIASIHGPIIDGRVFPHMAEIFDELESKFSGYHAMLGGDLNTARLAETIWPNRGHAKFFERFKAGPFFDCHWELNKFEKQTFFRENQIHKIQDDHLFVSRVLADSVKSCTALNTPETRRFSDHIPLVMEMDI